MTSLKKSLMLACAASVLGIGMAVAQTDPNAAAPAAPDAGAAAAPAAGAGGDAMAPAPKKHMSKKHSSKKHKKHMKSM